MQGHTAWNGVTLTLVRQHRELPNRAEQTEPHLQIRERVCRDYHWFKVQGSVLSVCQGSGKKANPRLKFMPQNSRCMEVCVKVSACTEKALNISTSSQAAEFLIYKHVCICQNREGNCQQTEGTRWKKNANKKHEKALTDTTLAYILTGDGFHQAQFSFTAPFLIYTTHLDKAHTKDQKYNPLGNLTFLSETAAFRCSFQLLALLSLKFPNS